MLKFLELLARLTGIATTELEAQLKANASEDGTLDKATVTKVLNDAFSDKFKKVGEEQLKRGKREKAEALEKEISDKYGVTGAKGIDLVKLAVEKAKPAAKTDELTKENALENEIVKDLQEELRTALKGKYEETITSLQTQIKDQAQKNHRAKVLGTAKDFYLKNKAKITTDGVLDARKWKTLEVLITQQKYKEVDGVLQLIDEKGNRVNDEFHEPIKFEDHLKELNPFGFHEFDPDKKGAEPGGKKGGAGGAGGSGKFSHIKTKEDLVEYITNRDTKKEDRVAAKEYFEKLEKK